MRYITLFRVSKTNPYINKMRYVWWRVFGRKGSVDVKVWEDFWRDVQEAADLLSKRIDERFLAEEISPRQRWEQYLKLESIHPLAQEFRARTWQQVLKEEILERRGDDPFKLREVKALPFPDAKSKKQRVPFKVGSKAETGQPRSK